MKQVSFIMNIAKRRTGKIAMLNQGLMIYGCYGYTGKLITLEAFSRGIRPVLAGRNRRKVQAMAEYLGLKYRCFEAESAEAAASGLQDASALLNCAGPFIATCVPLAGACLKNGTHYLDIAGEIEALEYLHGLDEKAQQANVVLCPGAGFDVIPTDCLAAALIEVLPDAQYLALAFDSESPVSPGTAKTILEGFRYGGKIRKRKVIVSAPLGSKIKRIDFGSGSKTAVSIPWGDVSTAFYTTGVPNIEVYFPLSEKAVNQIKIIRLFRPLLRMEIIKKICEKIIEALVKGPSLTERNKTPVKLWAEAVRPDGKRKTALLSTANAYDVTVHGALGIAVEVLSGDPSPGAYTPSRLMGTHYVSELSGSGPIRIIS